MKLVRTLGTSALLASSLACSGLLTPAPLPDTHTDYIGVWTNAEVRLEITPDGMLRYNRELGGGGSTELNNIPIQSWHETGFDAGLLGLTTTFTVESPPAEADGVWTMTVDGQALTRQ